MEHEAKERLAGHPAAAETAGFAWMRTFRAPGRVNLIGEHTDYSGGLVLPAAIDRGIELDCEPQDGVVMLASLGKTVSVTADGSSPAEGWGRYVAAVAAELGALGRPAVGLRGELRSDLPQGAGLSSSAALEVAVATALCAVADFQLEPLELAEACRRAEERAVGVPCGLMDQAASVLGRAGHALLLDCGTLEHRLVPIPDGLALLVVDSGVRRRLEDSAYADRRRELEAGDERRVRHVRTENERVRAAVEALAAGDLAAVGRLFAASHASLRDDFEVSTPELDRLVELALAAGAVAARLTGAGFGGSIVALVKAGEAERIGAEVVSAYPGRGTALVCRAADGAREL
jgi:galactokinase